MATVEDTGNLRVEVLGHWLAAPVAGSGGACSSYLVEAGGGATGQAAILLDCGPGTVSVLQERDLTRRLAAVVISHMDPDHVLGLVPLANLARTSAILADRSPRRLPLYLPREDGREVLAAVEAVWRSDSGGAAGERPEPFADVFEVIDYDQRDELSLGGMSLSFLRTRHHRPCYAPRVSAGRAAVVYSADTGYLPEMAEHAAGADLFLCEATLLEPHPRWTEEHGHLTGELAAELAARAGVRRLTLTHLGPDSRMNAANLARARTAFTGETELAESGRTYDL